MENESNNKTKFDCLISGANKILLKWFACSVFISCHEKATVALYFGRILTP